MPIPPTNGPSLIELSHPLFDGMPAYPGLPAVSVTQHMTYEESRGRYGEGTTFALSRIDIACNTGTYLDSPAHRFPGAADVGALPLNRLVDLPVVVAPCDQDEAGPVRLDVPTSGEWRGSAVLVRTGWSRRWLTDAYYEPGPYLTGDTAEQLVAAGVVLVGVDFANVDHVRDPFRAVHTTLLGADVLIVEHLTGLDGVPERGATLSVVPLAVQGATSIPVRAWARVPAGTGESS